MELSFREQEGTRRHAHYCHSPDPDKKTASIISSLPVLKKVFIFTAYLAVGAHNPMVVVSGSLGVQVPCVGRV